MKAFFGMHWLLSSSWHVTWNGTRGCYAPIARLYGHFGMENIKVIFCMKEPSVYIDILYALFCFYKRIILQSINNKTIYEAYILKLNRYIKRYLFYSSLHEFLPYNSVKSPTDFHVYATRETTKSIHNIADASVFQNIAEIQSRNRKSA